ncbi:hypothetical protein FN846DRAFT_966963 [Sphaerosporella brunnea]|uniref:Secreted protein n=1 Tax=Sphaerosporella brunnea TaxID=1250544 RepID=A0A5J5EK20_9PEZI|nr:hypothetical protein FN846DRAFT_966963 [Sphaerosporella brunnea]
MRVSGNFLTFLLRVRASLSYEILLYSTFCLKRTERFPVEGLCHSVALCNSSILDFLDPRQPVVQKSSRWGRDGKKPVVIDTRIRDRSEDNTGS